MENAPHEKPTNLEIGRYVRGDLPEERKEEIRQFAEQDPNIAARIADLQELMLVSFDFLEEKEFGILQKEIAPDEKQ